MHRTTIQDSAAAVCDPSAFESTHPARVPYIRCLTVGLGGLFFGVTAPLISTFVPPLVRDVLGEHRTAIGVVMAIDNVLLLLLVPLAGAASDRAIARGRGRLPIVLSGFVLSAIGMALFPWSPTLGIAGVIGTIVLLYSGINLLRSPFQALLADLVPSRFRSLANGSAFFQMSVSSIVFLMLGGMLGMRGAYLIAAGTLLAIAAVAASALRETPLSGSHEAEPTLGSLFGAVWSAVRGGIPALPVIFVALVLLQLTFQTFTTWFALHGMERFGIRAEDVTIGFIAWALGGAMAALPAGFAGVRFGRRHTMLFGFAMMCGCLLALDQVRTIGRAAPLLALASASWTFPMVNAYPLFVEPVPRAHRGVLAALYLLSVALAGAIGDPLNGRLFDLAGNYRPLFLMMACYSALAFAAVACVPRGAGEADTGPQPAEAPAPAR